MMGRVMIRMSNLQSSAKEATESPPAVAALVERNVSALVDRWRCQEKARTRTERLADTIAHFSGTMAFVMVHVVIFGLWVLANLHLLGVPAFDPEFVKLAVLASVEAILLSTFVLIAQKRTAREADRRAELSLHISLLSEHEITQIIKLVSAVAEKLNLEQAGDPALHELKQDIRPEHVLDNIEEKQRNAS